MSQWSSNWKYAILKLLCTARHVYAILKSPFITLLSLRNLIIEGCILRVSSSLLVVRILLLLFWLSPLAQCYLPKVRHPLFYQATIFLVASCPPLLLPMLNSWYSFYLSAICFFVVGSANTLTTTSSKSDNLFPLSSTRFITITKMVRSQSLKMIWIVTDMSQGAIVYNRLNFGKDCVQLKFC